MSICMKKIGYKRYILRWTRSLTQTSELRCGRVHCVPLFSEEICTALLEDLVSFHASGRQTSRANSNKRGLVTYSHISSYIYMRYKIKKTRRYFCCIYAVSTTVYPCKRRPKQVSRPFRLPRFLFKALGAWLRALPVLACRGGLASKACISEPEVQALY